MTDLTEFEDAQTIDELRATIDRLGNQLAKQKHKHAEVAEAVYRAASDGIAGLRIPAVPKPKSDRRRKDSEVAVAVLADWQLAKTTPDYNTEVCEERIERFADKVVELTDIQRADHPVRTAHVWALGDLIEGEMIFPGQHWLIDASLYRQVTLDGPRILGNFLRRMLATFEHVTFHGVVGNHGRLGGRGSKDMNAESNGDRMLYRITQQLIDADPSTKGRIDWVIPDGDRERHWYSVARIGDYSCLLAHGDQIRGHAGFPFYGLAKKAWGWATGAVHEPFKDVYIGHWHQPTRVTLNRITARVAGSPESYNTFAAEQLAAVGRPSQPLMFVHPERGMVTAEYTVWLDGDQ